MFFSYFLGAFENNNKFIIYITNFIKFLSTKTLKLIKK